MKQEELDRARKDWTVTQEFAVGDGLSVTLEKIKWVTVAKFDASLLDGDEIDVAFWEDWAGETIVARAVGHVWGETLDKRTIRHPLDWVEAVKERWLPWWLRRHWSVRYKVHHVEAKAYYPGLRPTLHNEKWRIAAYIGSEEERADD